MNKLNELELALIEEEMKRQDPDKFYWWKMGIYKNNPTLFVREMLGAEPTDQQLRALRSIASGTHVSIKSGHGTGKTAYLSWIILWWMFTRKNARIPCTAPSSDQLKNVLWAELSTWHNEMDPFFKNKFVCTSDKFYNEEFDKTWFSVARTARSEKPEALQGFHGKNLLFLVDEASGVVEEVFTVVRGALTDDRNRCVMTSNPTRTVGFFYNSHELWAGDPWTCLTFNGEESSIVGKRYIREIEVEFGKNSDVYRVRVLGEFPLESDYTLITKDWVKAALKRDIEATPRVGIKKYDSAGVDVARYGDNNTVFALVKGLTVVDVKKFEKQNTMKTAGQVVGLCKHVDPSQIRVDEIGVGAGVVDRVLELGHPIIGVDVSRSATDKDKFTNLRAQYFWDLRSRFEEGSISLKPLNEILGRKELVQLVEQLCSIRYEYNTSGKIVIWSKEKMRKDGLKSPDIADAIMLAFADYYPELFKSEPKTIAQKWSDKLEQPVAEYDDGFEQFANEFYRMSGYRLESDGDGDREDPMLWN